MPDEVHTHEVAKGPTESRPPDETLPEPAASPAENASEHPTRQVQPDGR